MQPSVIDQIRLGVCAVGYLPVPPEEYRKRNPGQAVPIEVIGSGFARDAFTVVTCAHVIEDLQKEMKRRRLAPNAKILQFVYPLSGDEWSVTHHAFAVASLELKPDIATLRTDVPIPVQAPPVVPFGTVLSVGEEVGVCGYPHGSTLLRVRNRIVRFGPLLQRGYIAALSPFATPATDLPSEIILDLRTAGAASGSPVFRIASGHVIGILSRGQIGKSASMAMAVPIALDKDGTMVAWDSPPIELRASVLPKTE